MDVSLLNQSHDSHRSGQGLCQRREIKNRVPGHLCPGKQIGMTVGLKKKHRIFPGDQQHGSGENLVRYGLPHHAVNLLHSSMSFERSGDFFLYRIHIVAG